MIKQRIVAFALLFTILAQATDAAVPLDKEERFKVYGDFRLRLETDWDSQDCNEEKRDDRSRARVRFRVGFLYDHEDYLTMGARIRSGSDDAHQSANITIIDLNHNDTGDVHFNFDKWFLKMRSGSFWMWVGRNTLPMWMQNEMFWGVDVIPAGVAAGAKFDVGECSCLKFNSGYLALPVGMKDFSGYLGLGQVVYNHDWRSGGVTLAGGVWFFDGNSDDPDEVRLLNGNGSRNYNVWIGNAQIRFFVKDHLIKVGGDFCHNSKSYSAADPDPFTAAHHNEKDGWVFSVQAGECKEKGDWLFRYLYADVDALATNSSYAQATWVRWGTAAETRATDIKGHGFWVGYTPCSNWFLLARLYLVEAKSSAEDGKRARLDCVFSF